MTMRQCTANRGALFDLQVMTACFHVENMAFNLLK